MTVTSTMNWRSLSEAGEEMIQSQCCRENKGVDQLTSGENTENKSHRRKKQTQTYLRLWQEKEDRGINKGLFNYLFY